MPLEMETPARAARGNPEHDLAGALIFPEYASTLAKLQARQLTRRFAMSATLAAIVASLAFGEART